jgi:hypothetical protein
MSLSATAIATDLPRAQAAAFRRKAKRLGLTAEEYLKQLIQDDLALDLAAERTSLDELTAPFRKALAGVTNAEIDSIVKTSRKRPTRSKHGH